MDNLLVNCSNCKLPISHRCPEDGPAYVVTGMDSVNITRERDDPVWPIVFETLLNETSLEHARDRLQKLAAYAPLRVAVLTFVDDHNRLAPPKDYAVKRNALHEVEHCLDAVANYFGAITQGTEADTQQARDAVGRVETALRECYELLNNSDVRLYISTKLGEQAQLHHAINAARQALPLSK
jgi:hypothetical protein